MNTNTNTNTPEPSMADLHASVARALHFSLTNLRSMATMKMLEEVVSRPGDEPMKIEVPIVELSVLIGTFITSVALCIKHDALDQGAIESVWAEHLDEAELKSHANRFESMIKHIGEVERKANV